MLSDISKAELKRVLVIRVQPEDRRIFLLMSADIFDRQLSLSNPPKTMKDDRGSTTSGHEVARASLTAPSLLQQTVQLQEKVTG